MMDCKQARPLVSAYVDGELSELQADGLRKHLIDCQPCRAEVQEQKSFQAWFVPTPEVEVPADFVARVARRAFAGDTGEREDVLVPAAPLPKETPILQFSLRIAMAAAVVLMLVSISIGLVNQPAHDAPVSADSQRPEVEEILEKLDELKEREAAGDAEVEAETK